MSENSDLMAQARDRVGKGAARELRRNNMVPAVIYGDKKPPLSIAIPYIDVNMRIHGGGFMTTILTLDVDGEKHSVLPKDYQLDVVRDFPLHVDFLRVTKKTIVTVDIPVSFINEEECPGLKVGGVLNIVRHTVECNSPADSIPDALIIDLGTFELGDSINISATTLPDGVEPTITDRDFTIATIASPAALKSDDGEEEVDVDDVEIIGEATEEEGETNE